MNIWCSAKSNGAKVLFPDEPKVGDDCFIWSPLIKKVKIRNGKVVAVLKGMHPAEETEKVVKLSDYHAWKGVLQNSETYFFQATTKSELSEDDFLKMEGRPMQLCEQDLNTLPFEEMGIPRTTTDSFDLLNLMSIKYGRYTACQNAHLVGLSFNQAHEELFDEPCRDDE